MGSWCGAPTQLSYSMLFDLAKTRVHRKLRAKIWAEFLNENEFSLYFKKAPDISRIFNKAVYNYNISYYI